jgi:hypothetical protein
MQELRTLIHIQVVHDGLTGSANKILNRAGIDCSPSKPARRQAFNHCWFNPLARPFYMSRYHLIPYLPFVGYFSPVFNTIVTAIQVD